MPDPHMSVSPEPRAGAALYRLLAWLSPSFPVAFCSKLLISHDRLVEESEFFSASSFAIVPAM